MNNKTIVLASRPTGMPTAAQFRLEKREVPTPEHGQLLLKTLYVSVDPYMRGRMSEAKSYIAPFAVGEPITGGVVAEVVESHIPQLPVGSVVVGNLPWQQYSVADAKTLNVTQTPGFFVNGRPLTDFGYQQLKALVEAEVKRAYPQ